MPAVLGLGNKLLESLSTACVMRYITDRTIRKESVFFVLIVAFFFCFFLLFGYKINVEWILYKHLDEGGAVIYSTIDENLIWSTVFAIALYFAVKELITFVSLYNILDDQ